MTNKTFESRYEKILKTDYKMPEAKIYPKFLYDFFDRLSTTSKIR
ncbi:hypothetical protein [Leptotrichia wadei]|nr:hypothetical protein [Leptotrichia wadei]